MKHEEPATGIAVLTAALIYGFFMFDVCVVVAWQGRVEHGTFPTVGVCSAQVALLAIWAALGPGTIVVRLPLSYLLGTLMWYAIVLGFRHPSVPEFILHDWVSLGLTRVAWADSLLLGAVLLTGITVLEVPYWIAARLFRWQLCRCPTQIDDLAARKSQFNIKHLMLVVFLCALALALGRVVLPPPDDFGLVGIGRTEELLAVLIALLVSNVLITVPAVWSTFARMSQLAVFAAAWLSYCAVLTVAEIKVLEAFFGLVPLRPRVELYLGYYVLNISQWLTVTCVLLILRALGFRLQRPCPDGVRQ